jgi:uncharacterized protein
VHGPAGPGDGPSRWARRAEDLARIVAFVGLLLAFGLVLGAAWGWLPLPDTGAWVFAGTIVTAAAAVLAGGVLLRFADDRPLAALGVGVTRQTLPHAVLGFAIGAAGLLAAAACMLATGSLRYGADAGTGVEWVAAVAGQGAVFAIAAFAEEALFRGYAFQVLARAAGPAVATALSAVLFAVAHGANPEVGAFALINIFLAGVLLALAYLRTLSLWFATAVHMAWNWTMASLLDLPVSGIQLFDTPLYQPSISGPAWWSGGAFGPEGGMVGTIGFGVALVMLLTLRRVAPDTGIAAARPLVLDRALAARRAPLDVRSRAGGADTSQGDGE